MSKTILAFALAIALISPVFAEERHEEHRDGDGVRHWTNERHESRDGDRMIEGRDGWRKSWFGYVLPNRFCVDPWGRRVHCIY